MQLILNALKHGSGKVVKVSISLSSNYDSSFYEIKASVRDKGDGIKSDTLHKIFGMFNSS